MNNWKLYSIPGLLILLFSCDRPECKNSNYIFDHFTLDSKEYKDELAQQLQINNEKDLTYWFDRYELQDNKEYMIIYIQGKELCARGKILVHHWGELEGIKRTKGVSYRGAELVGLKN